MYFTQFLDFLELIKTFSIQRKTKNDYRLRVYKVSEETKNLAEELSTNFINEFFKQKYGL